MSKEWKRVVAVLSFTAGCAALAVIMLLLESKNTAERFEIARAASIRVDSAAIARDSVQRADNDRRMREYMKQHPAAVRDKY
ncbi:MAG: hypothetical protein IPI01_06435 [Ignavibacteriae bacterium]|nr:hypothetical protein [Ignavibacteriota bacterium]